MNLAILKGTLATEPETRALASGATVANFDLATPAVDTDHTSERVNISVTEPTHAVLSLAAGDAVVVVGVVRRRFFRSSGSTTSRTEVVADHVLKASHTKKVQAAVRQAIEPLADADLLTTA